jgi:hypothetical protein
LNVRAVLPEVGAGQLGAMRYLIASAGHAADPALDRQAAPCRPRSGWPAVARPSGLFGLRLYRNLGMSYGERTVNAGTGSMLISCIPVW